MGHISHKLQLVCSSLLGALAFVGFVFFVRKKAKKLKFESALVFEANQDQDYSPELFAQQETSLTPFVNRVAATLNMLVEDISENFPPTYPFAHHSVYYGSAGLSFLFWRLFRSQTRDNRLRDIYLQLSLQYIESSKSFYENTEANPRDPTHFSCGFLFGQSGYYTMQAFLNHITRDEDKSEEFLQKLVSELHKATNAYEPNFNMMYGTAGYFSCCVFLREHIPSFPLDIIPILFGYLIAHGEEDWRKMQSYKPLIDREARKRLGFIYPPRRAFRLVNWMNRKTYGTIKSLLIRPILWIYFKTCVWNQSTELYGMLHGNIGTLYQLLACPELVHSSREATVLLRNSLEFLLQLHNETGFIPTGILPVHHEGVNMKWSNGETGFGMLFARAFQVFQDERYIDVARQISDIVWERGLAKNENSISNGVAGNAYLFLTLYRITKKDKFLYRARCFALYICKYYENRNENTKLLSGEFPSLFEGLGGVVLFLSDILDPDHSHFPILEDSI